MMLQISFWLFALALLGGLVLVVRFIHTGGVGAPPWALALGHGGIGTLALILLFLALEYGPVRGAGTGSSNFGATAAVLFGIALAFGTLLLRARSRGRTPIGLTAAAHAGAAIAGFVILLVYLLLG